MSRASSSSGFAALGVEAMTGAAARGSPDGTSGIRSPPIFTPEGAGASSMARAKGSPSCAIAVAESARASAALQQNLNMLTCVSPSDSLADSRLIPSGSLRLQLPALLEEVLDRILHRARAGGARREDRVGGDPAGADLVDRLRELRERVLRLDEPPEAAVDAVV